MLRIHLYPSLVFNPFPSPLPLLSTPFYFFFRFYSCYALMPYIIHMVHFLILTGNYPSPLYHHLTLTTILTPHLPVFPFLS